VLVTGGASGLGAAVARAVAQRGGTVTVLDRRPSADGLPTEVVDLTDTLAAERAVHDAAEAHGGLWAVVTAAGIDGVEDVALDDWERVVAVNMLGTASVVRAALPYLRASGGRIVTVASALGHRGLADAEAYGASRFEVVGFTQALVAELRTALFDRRSEPHHPPEEVADAVVLSLAA